MRQETEADEGRLSGIEARLEQITADTAALRVALKTPTQNPAQADPAWVLSRFEVAERRLRHALEQMRASEDQELRALLATLTPRRGERLLLWGIAVLQFATLAVATVLLMLAQ